MLVLKNINRIFMVGDQRVHALRDINLEINKGEYITVMGPSGSGKSTLLNILGLLDTPDSGQYHFKQQDVTALSDTQQAAIRCHEIGFVFQFFHLLPRLSAAENIALPMVLAGIDPIERKRRTADLLEKLDLNARAHHKPDQLSGGQRQRVAIGRATIMQPSLILADEPTGNLDRHSGQEVIQLLETLNAQGMTLIIVTHDPELGDRARRKLIFQDGAIINENKQSA